MNRRMLVATVAVALLGAAPQAARADLAAAYEEWTPSTGFDVKLVDPVTGARLPLPTAAATPQCNQLHPAVGGANGRIVAWEVQGPLFAGDPRQACTPAVVVADRMTGTYRAITECDRMPVAQWAMPSVSPNGRRLAFHTRNPLDGTYRLCIVSVPAPDSLGTGAIKPVVQVPTSVVDHRADTRALLPNGVAIADYDGTTQRQPYALASNDQAGTGSALRLGLLAGGNAVTRIADTPGAFLTGHPAISQVLGGSDPYTVVYDRIAAGNDLRGDILSAGRSGAGFGYPFNTAADEGWPAVASGRYIGFVRRTAGRRVLFVFDYHEQAMERAGGLDIGPDGFAGGTGLAAQAAYHSRIWGSLALGEVTPTSPFLVGAR